MRDHEAQPRSNRAVYPDLRVTINNAKSGKSSPEEKLPAACELLEKLTNKLPIYSFGTDYVKLAQRYQLLGLQSFCEWCTGQQIIMQKLIHQQKAIYQIICKACNRDPLTPHISESGTKDAPPEN